MGFVHQLVQQIQEDVSATGSSPVLRSQVRQLISVRPNSRGAVQPFTCGQTVIGTVVTCPRLQRRTAPNTCRSDACRRTVVNDTGETKCVRSIHGCMTQTLRKWQLVAAAICGSGKNYTLQQRIHTLAHSAAFPSHTSFALFIPFLPFWFFRYTFFFIP